MATQVPLNRFLMDFSWQISDCTNFLVFGSPNRRLLPEATGQGIIMPIKPVCNKDNFTSRWRPDHQPSMERSRLEIRKQKVGLIDWGQLVDFDCRPGTPNVHTIV